MVKADLMKSYEDVYYVDVAPSVPYNPIAIRPHFYSDKAAWEDTSKGKIVYLGSIDSELTDEAPDIIELTSREGIRVTLRRMTLDVYNEYVKHRVYGSPTFENDEELKHFYLTKGFPP